jgi:hypothetical protein
MWISLEALKSNLAMDLLSEMEDMATLEQEWDSAKFQSLVFNSSYNNHWTTLKRLFDRPYWSRVWILQEVVLARQAVLQCGSRTIS